VPGTTPTLALRIFWVVPSFGEYNRRLVDVRPLIAVTKAVAADCQAACAVVVNSPVVEENTLAIIGPMYVRPRRLLPDKPVRQL
jgi:hypothetical protein